MTTPADGTEGWQLTAAIEPKGPEKEAGDQANPTELAPLAWKEGAEGVRTTVKWMVTAFGAVGAVMFAKGFVTTPELSWHDDTGQLLAAWLVGTAGLAGIGWLVFQVVDLIRPSFFELGTLPSGYLDLVDAEPRFYLPSDCATFAEYLTNLQTLRRLADETASEVGQATVALEAAQQTEDPSAISAAELRLERATLTHTSVLRGLTVYKSTRRDLLDRAGYWQASQGLTFSTPTLVAAAVLAAAGGIGYQLLLAHAEEEKPAAEPAAPVVVGELIQADSDAGRDLWRQLRLASCQRNAASARIPVVVADGKGTEGDPYVVSTVPNGRCAAATFTVINGVATVNVPEKNVISYEP